MVLPAPRQILTDSVYEAVKAVIMDNAVPAGTKLNMDALARDLQVSPTPIREALARLESEQLVVKLPLRGYTTTPLITRGQFEDLYDFRLHLEPWAAARAAGRAAGGTALHDELDRCPETPPGGTYDDYKSLANHDARFHELVMHLSGNRSGRDALAHTHWHLHIFRLHYGRAVAVPVREEHGRIVTAIASGDPEAAAAAMRAHLVRARDRLRPHLG